MKKENYFILQTYDEDLKMRIQFHYWTAVKYYYSSCEREDGVTVYKKRISEKRYNNALEEYYNC